MHAYLAQHIQPNQALACSEHVPSAQRPEEPFVMASDVIRKWTPQSAPPRLSRPTGGATVGAREYLESVGILKTLSARMAPSDSKVTGRPAAVPERLPAGPRARAGVRAQP